MYRLNEFVKAGKVRALGASPIVGATKEAYLTDAAEALKVSLTADDIAYLEEMYVPHPIVGAIKQNPPQGVMLPDEKK